MPTEGMYARFFRLKENESAAFKGVLGLEKDLRKKRPVLSFS
jgi:hypothetical protein